jgi:tetratricopeptide (TPR) repeat protein
VQACRKLVELEPSLAQAHGYLGDALLAAGDKAGAKRHLERAHLLDPSYRFAGLNAFDLQLAEHQLDLAAETLGVIGRYEQGAQWLLRGLRLSVARGDAQAAAEQLTRLAISEDCGEVELADGYRELERLGGKAVVGACLQRAIEAGQGNRHAVVLWLREHVESQGRGYQEEALTGLVTKHDHAAYRVGVMSWLSARPERFAMGRRLVNAHRVPFSRDVESWGMVGYFLLQRDLHLDVVQWMSDWRSRDDAPAWALGNLALACRFLDRIGEAREVSQRVLAMEPGDSEARIWLAADAAVAGDLATLEPLLEGVQAERERPYYAVIAHLLIGAMVTLRSQDSAEALRHFRAASRGAQTQGEHRNFATLRAILAWRLSAFTRPLWLRPWRWLQLRWP